MWARFRICAESAGYLRQPGGCDYLVVVAGAVASEAEAIFSTPDGQPALRIVVSHPQEEITREFFDSLDLAVGRLDSE